MFHDTIPIGAGEALAPASIPPRQALIDAARAELRTRSPAQVTMQDVADRAGLSRRTLYNQFADRDCLFDAVVQELVGRIDNGMHFDPNDGGADELPALGDLLFAFSDYLLKSFACESHREILSLISTGQIPSAAPTYHARIRDPLSVRLERRLLRMALRGVPVAPNPGEEINRIFSLMSALAAAAGKSTAPLITASELATMFCGRLTASSGEDRVPLQAVRG